MVYFVFYNDDLGNPVTCYGEWYDEELVKGIVKELQGHCYYYYVGVSEAEL